MKQNTILFQMQILFLLYDLHFGGGGERVTVNLANSLINRGHNVTILSLASQKNDNIFAVDPRIKIDYLGTGNRFKQQWINKIYSLNALRDYFGMINEPTVALAIGAYPSLLLSLLPQRSTIKKVGCQHHAFSALNKYWSLLRRMFFNRLDLMVSLTEADRTKLKQVNPRVVVIPNAVSFYPVNKAKLENKIILAVGRVDQPKGFDLLIDAFARITTDIPGWKLRIVGDGPQKNELVRHIEQSGLSGNIEWLPPTNNIEQQYMQAAMLVSTSRTEGLPMIMLEAQACGLPVVSFDIETGPNEIITDGKDGFLVKPFDTKQMAHKIKLLCETQTLRTTFGENARQNALRFSPDKIIIMWERLFNQFSFN